MNAAKTSFALLAAALTITSAAFAQGPSGVPQAATGGQLMGHHHASTVGESILRGEADVIRAAGEADYNHSTAALIREGAYSAHLDNQVKYTETFFQKRAINAAARAIERGMPACPETLARFNRERTPCRLASHQLDPISAGIRWPVAFECKCFNSLRGRVDRLFAERTPDNSGVGSKNYRDVQATICAMRHMLRHQIHEMDSAEYGHARKFIDSLGYEARHPLMPGGEGGEQLAGHVAPINEDVAAIVNDAINQGGQEGFAQGELAQGAVAPQAGLAENVADAVGLAVAEGAPVVEAPIAGN